MESIITHIAPSRRGRAPRRSERWGIRTDRQSLKSIKSLLDLMLGGGKEGYE